MLCALIKIGFQKFYVTYKLNWNSLPVVMAMKFNSIVLMVSQREITKDYAYMFAKIAWNM